MSDTIVPVVYEHAAQFLGKSPREVSLDSSLIYSAHKAAYLHYGHTPVTVGIDIYNPEAEAYGAVVDEAEGNEVPSLFSSPCSSVKDLVSLDFFDPGTAGRFGSFIKAALRLQKEFSETSVKMPVSGPFSIASNLIGFENLLMAMITDTELVRSALKHLAEGQLRLMEYIGKMGLGVTIFESAAAPPLISPDMFRKILKPLLAGMIGGAVNILGSPPAFILGGDTAPIAGDLAELGSSFLICPAETDQKSFLKNLGARDVIVRCNLPAELVETGSDEDLLNEIKKLSSLIGDRPKTVIGTGVLSYGIDIGRVARINSLLFESTG